MLKSLIFRNLTSWQWYEYLLCLASQDALEVMGVSESVSEWVMVSWLDWCEWWYFAYLTYSTHWGNLSQKHTVWREGGGSFFWLRGYWSLPTVRKGNPPKTLSRFCINIFCLENTSRDRASWFDSVCNLSREERNVLCMKIRENHFNHTIYVTIVYQICNKYGTNAKQICNKYETNM